MVKMFSFIPGILLILACHKSNGFVTGPDNPGGTNPAQTDTLPPQYGTPFGQVPAPADAVIYQVNFRSFSAGDNFKGVQARLDSIKALGVNVLYLMPTYPVGQLKSVNSPYCVKDFLGVNSEFGALSDLRSLIDQAHARNMAVILDWVADHTSWDNAWISNKSWYQQDASGNIISPPGTGWNDVAALNYANTQMRQAMIHAMKYWIYAANVDGYRFDAADFVPFDFWQQALDSLSAIHTHKLLYFGEGTRNDHFRAGFQMLYGMGFYYTMKDQVFGAGRPVTLIDSVNTAEYANAGATGQIVRYTSNHDVDNSDGTPLDLFGGKTGSIATFLVAAYMHGVPMIYNGQEVGCPIKLNYFNTTTVIDWTINPDITATYKQLIAFRQANPVVRTGPLQSYSNNDVVVFTKGSGSTQVLVIANLRNASVSYNLPAALTGISWTNAFGGAGLPPGGQLNLGPYQYLVLQNY